MGKLSFAKLAAAVGGVGLALTAGSGIASAAPEDDAINTTCNQKQVLDALADTNPGAYAQLTASPMAMSYLNQFLASPPSQRRAMAAQIAALPGASDYVTTLSNVAHTCQNYQ